MISNEVLELFRKRTGDDSAKFQDVWRLKSRLVTGERLNL